MTCATNWHWPTKGIRRKSMKSSTQSQILTRSFAMRRRSIILGANCLSLHGQHRHCCPDWILISSRYSILSRLPDLVTTSRRIMIPRILAHSRNAISPSHFIRSLQTEKGLSTIKKSMNAYLHCISRFIHRHSSSCPASCRNTCRKKRRRTSAKGVKSAFSVS